jgi:hypothetical protein
MTHVEIEIAFPVVPTFLGFLPEASKVAYL